MTDQEQLIVVLLLLTTTVFVCRLVYLKHSKPDSKDDWKGPWK